MQLHMRILVVEDDELIAKLVEKNLILEGYDTFLCNDGLSCIENCKNEHFDMIILDIMLPGMDGFHVCRELCSIGVHSPIIMLTAKNDISDKLIGLEAGADDYIVKPFDTRELMARVKAIFRRLEKLDEDNCSRKEPTSSSSIIRINEETRRVYINNALMDLTHTEFELLLLLSKNPDRVFTRAQLMDMVWGYDFLGDSRTVDIHIQRMRKKLGEYSVFIDTVFGVGYRFTPPH
jgi:DNA-binding response OmpR family regulator